MLISRVPEESAGRGEPAADIVRNCQTASELFELMTKDHDFEAGDDPLTTSDLVLLYKNIDLGNQLMTNVRVRPNQYVENVYHDDPETDSDLSESCSSEELRNIVLANQERIDLFTNTPSLNSLCHKLGDLEIQVSNISDDLYDHRHFLHKNPYIKEQLHNLQFMTRANELKTALFPTSLLDYICCKRLEDNYNFYMDNIITYVTHTIDQLKRISNGDYLPDKVKEKWLKCDNNSTDDASKVLTTSVSMPLQVKQKATGLSTAWDDIVHTEVDLRSLLKIMEKKIVFEVPRMISGSYIFLSKHGPDKLVISCSRRRSSGKLAQAESRVDVVLSVNRAEAGQLVSKIDSIMILQPKPQITEKDGTEQLTLQYKNEIPESDDTLTSKVVELQDVEQSSGSKSPKSDEFGSNCSLNDATDSRSMDQMDTLKDDTNSSSTVPRPGSPAVMAQILTSAARVVRAEAASNHATPNELNFSMTPLNRATSLPEESTSEPFYTKTKKKSPERIRVKSPYENKSYILEERKRRKLLEIRERRERRKLASIENTKVSKHKAFPQAVSSVTKLSITNKAFYNSIYGRNLNGVISKRSTAALKNMKALKGTHKIDEETEHESGGDIEREEALPGKSNKKLCKGHFLDDTETEVSYLQSKQDSSFLQNSTSTSVDSKESTMYIYPHLEYCSSLTSFHVNDPESPIALENQSAPDEVTELKMQEALNKEPENTPKVENDTAPAVECRRSLEKIYTLMKKLHQIETSETAKKKPTPSEPPGLRSESGSSLKRRVSFSNPKVEKHIDEIHKSEDEDLPRTAVPKAVISAKLIPKPNEKTRKPKPLRVQTIPENPLKAISQLLHQFDNVQKAKPKIADPKSINRSMLTENAEHGKTQKRRPRVETPVKEDSKVNPKVKTRFFREERPEVVKPHVLDKKINDLIDEEKEARGEAVRGPPRFSSRLNALAQPKRVYVQANAEQFPRRQIPERPQRPTSHYSRTRRRADGNRSPGSVKAPYSPLGRTAKPCRSAASSPEQRLRESPQFATLAAVAANALHALKKPVAVDPAVSCRGAERASSARAPLLPRDLQLSSVSSCATDDAQVSSAIGLKLHRMVSAMLRSQRPSSAAEDPSPPFPGTAIHEAPTTTQIGAEKFVVENTEEVIIEEIHETCDEKFEDIKHAITPANSVTELKMLEHALHHSLSSGAFAGRLRVNKLTLTPRPSLQRVIMHQSGDTTLLLESDLHQKIKVTCQASDHKTDLMGLLTKTRLNCGFTGFPLQISTVGYAFPTFQCKIEKVTPRRIHREMLETSDTGTSCVVREQLTSTADVMEISEEKRNTCQCKANEPETKCVTNEVCAPRKKLETDTNQVLTSEAPVTVESSDKEVNNASVVKENCQASDYTTSFDILVGLLNEIQKMTTCGGDAASAQSLESASSETNPEESTTDASSSQRSDDTESNPNVSSDEQLRTFTPETKTVSAEAVEHKPVCEDKEVSVRTALRNAAASTSHQAGFPNGIATSTSTNLPTSSRSVSAFTHSEYFDKGCNTSMKSGDEITKQTGIEANRTSVKSLVPYYNNMFKVVVKKDDMVAPENSIATVTQRNVAAVCNILVDIPPVKKSKKRLGIGHGVNIQSNKAVNNLCPNATELDSTLKVKRDILVTFYSILVLTVFAALAFPELLQFA